MRTCLLGLLLMAGCSTPASTSRKAASVASMFAPRSETPAQTQTQTQSATQTPTPGATPMASGSSTCIPVCESGWRCNDDLGQCVRLPCMGRCRPDQRCDTSGPIESCRVN